jgi:hypothetical protein
MSYFSILFDYPQIWLERILSLIRSSIYIYWLLAQGIQTPNFKVLALMAKEKAQYVGGYVGS